MSAWSDRSRYEGLPVLVTGGAGFLGSNLIRALLGVGASVNCLQRPGSDLSRIERILGEITLLSVDVRDRSGVSDAIRKCEPRIVFHLAAYGVRPELNSAVDAYETNVLGLLNILESLDPKRIGALVNTGSCFEYPGEKEGALTETDLTAPTSPYAASKTASVELAKYFAKVRGLPVSTLRPFTFYGPFESPSRFIPSVIKASLKGEDVRLTGGCQTRDFVYVEDVVRAFLCAGTCPEAVGQVINVGSGESWRISDVAKEVVTLLDSKSRIQLGVLPYRPSEFWHLRADVSKAKKVLAWSPEVSLKEGIARTAAWMTVGQA